jgi:transposase
MHRHELSDEQWQLIADLFPSNQGKEGGQWSDHRKVLNGMFWRLNTGAPWRDLPERYGPWKTVYDRFNRYRREGFIDKLLERLQVRIDEKGLIDWDLFCVDGSNVRASRAAAGAGQKAPPASLRTTRWAARAAAGAASSTWLLTVRELRWPCT